MIARPRWLSTAVDAERRNGKSGKSPIFFASRSSASARCFMSVVKPASESALPLFCGLLAIVHIRMA